MLTSEVVDPQGPPVHRWEVPFTLRAGLVLVGRKPALCAMTLHHALPRLQHNVKVLEVLCRSQMHTSLTRRHVLVTRRAHYTKRLARGEVLLVEVRTESGD